MPEILPAAAYTRTMLSPMGFLRNGVSPLDDRHAYNSAPDDEGTIPRYYFTPSYLPSGAASPDSIGDDHGEGSSIGDFPTPRAGLFDNMRTPVPSPRRLPEPCDPPSPASSNRSSDIDNDFDSLYDITDDEEEVPLKCSASVKKIATRSSRNRYPSLVIPSPSAWPTIEKLQSAKSAIPPTPSQLLSPSFRGLSALASHNLRVPTHSAAPSLDGSMTSEELDKLSCPSTPDGQKRRSTASDGDWGVVQLDFQALETLQHLGQSSSDELQEQQVAQVIESRGEMQEVTRPFLGLSIPTSVVQNGSIGNTPLSPLSVPSPGGFFSSLLPSARHTWSLPKRDASIPNTSTAEKFYSLPWDSRRAALAEQIVSVAEQHTLAGSTLDGYDDPLPTSRPVFLGEHDEELEIKEINPSRTIFQYNEKYNAELQKSATVNLERTGHWLEEQDELLAALKEMSIVTSPSTSSGTHSRENSQDKIVKKSVKFAEVSQKPSEEEKDPKQIVTYVQGFQYLRDRSRKNDPYIHRQTRAEAMHVYRRCMPQSHRDQLLGKFELTNPVRPSPPRPVSEFYMNDPTVLKERIARAQMERQALDQMLPTTWVLQAQRQLNGGKLLSKQAVRCVSRAREPRILDVGGIPTNDWAWQVSGDFPYSMVTSVYLNGGNLSPNVSGPDNHRHTVVPNLWTLPYPSSHFDVISARSLYELLKTDKPLGRSMDEYDLCLKECYRCLKPGGILEFSLMDSDIIQPGPNAQAMGVEFGFNLKTRGYDGAPTKSFLPRLRKAGFKDVQRTWMVLPMGKTAANWKDTLAVGAESKQEEKSITMDGQVEVNEIPTFGSTVDAAMMTGIVGSWLWERWILRLQVEMGKEEDKLLEGVVQVLEEAAREGSGWRYLTGYARK